MAIDYKNKFVISHLGFLLSLATVYYLPRIAFALNDFFLPPMHRYLRFYIIGVFSLIFIFYYLFLYYYHKLNIALTLRNTLGLYFWLSTTAVFIFLCSSCALLSHDLYEYSLRARMASMYGLNPYLHIPAEIKQDIFFPLLFWKKTPECYGPLWVLLGTVHTFFFKSNLLLTAFMHKVVLMIFLLSSCHVFYKICRQLKLPNANILTMALVTNPLVIIMTIVDGHNEIAMVFFILSALYFLLTSRYVLSFAMLTFSIHVKFVYVLLVPLFIIHVLCDQQNRTLRSRIYEIIIAGIVSIGAAFMLWLPFGKESVMAIITYYKDLGHNFWYDSIPFVCYALLQRIGIAVSKPAVESIFSIVFLLTYIYCIYYYFRIAARDKQAIFTISSFIFLSLFFTNATPFQAWYLLWVIPFILLSRINSKFLLVYCLSYFLIMTFWKRMSVLAIPMIAVYIFILKSRLSQRKELKFLFSLT